MKLTVRTCIPVRSATSFVALVTVFLVDLSATARLTVLEARTRTVVITVLAPYLLPGRHLVIFSPVLLPLSALGLHPVSFSEFVLTLKHHLQDAAG